ncbi:hypothetical protein NQ314_015925 [Rhamnusium bicolor]|uniref:RIB43A-like with coiled-coils protein 2 n=1 Tax=Rhamnusium bicolor TaxID=1586634 RepID=A0AAV8WXG3_9CUCU|nr:hypothetical protein NQ314_015925 [Rhamnusium bicolor]
MLNFQLMTERDRREAAAIEKRRQFEEERKKEFLILIDTATLERQVEEKTQRVSEQKRIDSIFEEQLKKADEIAIALDRKEKRSFYGRLRRFSERAKLQFEINNFRKNYQKPEDRREYDLNDPNLIKKELPPRFYDEDPRLGPSSAQKFEGEDLQNEQRAKIQREEIRAWLDQQVREKNMADKEQKAADEAYKAAADEKYCEKQNRNRQTTEDNMAEIYNSLTSDLLSESHEVAQSNLGLDRRIGFVYKGMTAKKRKSEGRSTSPN